jgi:hypothetical protein
VPNAAVDQVVPLVLVWTVYPLIRADCSVADRA